MVPRALLALGLLSQEYKLIFLRILLLGLQIWLFEDIASMWLPLKVPMVHRFLQLRLVTQSKLCIIWRQLFLSLNNLWLFDLV